jgi:hypothetical protein
VDQFPEWWSWLRRFDCPSGLVPGAVAHCEVRAPLPYSLRFDVRVDSVDPASALHATVSGDIGGPARLTIEPAAAGSIASLWWEVDVHAPVLRTGARVARPLMAWGHEWVVATGVRQFRRHALDPLSGP